MLGLFTIWRGESQVREKINEIEIGFSRDGFHWDRPDRATFLGVSQTEGAWNYANVQSAGGGCLVVGDLSEQEKLADLLREKQIEAVTALGEFQEWSKAMSPLLARPPKREAYLVNG